MINNYLKSIINQENDIQNMIGYHIKKNLMENKNTRYIKLHFLYEEIFKDYFNFALNNNLYPKAIYPIVNGKLSFIIDLKDYLPKIEEHPIKFFDF